ncbi:MAG: hypothetical protein GXP62_11115 [Oligoflexia bacterium]|nr:hypothetical protein [Oligoflexia bacterium]
MSPRALWTRLAQRLDHREPATPLALFRIAMGLSILYTLLPMASAGITPLVWMDRAYGGYRVVPPDNWVLSMLGGATDASLPILVWVACGAALLLIVGFGSRVTPLVAGQAMIALFSINPQSAGGHDHLLTAGLWLLVVSPSTATLSLDSRWFSDEHRFVNPRPVVAWPRYLVIFQLIIVSFTAGVGQLGPALFWLWRLASPLWLLAFWYRLTHDRPGRLRALFNRLDVRSGIGIFGLCMYLAILILADLGPFSFIAMSFYLGLWHHDEYAALWNRLRNTTRKRPRILSADP